MALVLEPIRLERWEEPWDGGPDTVFQTRAWLDFLRATQGGEPLVARVVEGQEVVAHFTGVAVRKLGVGILGSPLKGWTTISMGFSGAGSADRRRLLGAVAEFAFRHLGCAYLELVDPGLRDEECDGLPVAVEHWCTFELDLRHTEAELFAAMTSACRRAVRKAVRSGVVVERADDLQFADEYYDQLLEVFARQRLVPTYPRRRVQELVRHLLPTGDLLLLRARAPDGRCIATGIFPGHGDSACFWGGASRRAHQILRPNEALMWHAIRYWKGRGARVFDLGGAAGYKRKYGGTMTRVPRVLWPRHPSLLALRALAKRLYRWQQVLRGALRAA